MKHDPILYAEAESIRERFMAKIMDGEEHLCPCCSQYSKLYHRTIHSTVAAQLIQLYRLGGEHQYVHVSKLLPKNASGIGDFPKASHWGLIQEHPEHTDAKRTSGLWKLTPEGVLFVRGAYFVPKYARVYNGELMNPPFEGKQVSIVECLGKKFNYSEMMEA